VWHDVRMRTTISGQVVVVTVSTSGVLAGRIILVETVGYQRAIDKRLQGSHVTMANGR